jgi:demethylmenaquinone methyltransferase/2-methoxy-6-polyprenyl-1,4-benzoquinol methylase
MGTGSGGVLPDRAEFIPSLFDRIARHYDLMNMIMTAGVWRSWQRTFRRHAGIGPGSAVLDVGCGTAELSLLLAQMTEPGGTVAGIDISERMLEVGREKVGRSRFRDRIRLQQGDALALPFADGTFDAAASAFVMRNVSDLDGALREAARALRPGGRLAIMELSHPPAAIIRVPYLLYFRHILPLLGTWAARARLPVAPYAWLPRSLETFPPAEAFAARIAAAGFADVRFRRLTGGIVCLHTARRP